MNDKSPHENARYTFFAGLQLILMRRIQLERVILSKNLIQKS